MSKLPWSKALKEAKARGETVKVFDTDHPVMYKPRQKFDPEPWYDPLNQTYHNGKDCYADLA